MADRPRAREKNVTSGSAEVHKKGAGIGGGPVGSGSAFQSGGGGSNRAGGGGKSKLIGIVVVAVILLLSGGKGLGSFLSSSQTGSSYDNEAGSQAQSGAGTQNSGSPTAGDEGAYEPNRNVSELAREKYTAIKGDGTDQITLMVYMCGTDLESKNGMATNDLTEMTKASLSDKLNLIVFTGGCNGWKNQIVSSQKNQIYQVKDGGLKLLKENAGNKPMTDPDNLTDFIRFCTDQYPANRNMLILWDHGGGSISGFGYDEKNPKAGSMNLAGIDKALNQAGTKFDFIGFDACLMATIETDLMAADYADYLIGSEETEPGVGWYYTDWLTALAKDPGMSTVDIGKKIVDDFVSVCARTTPNQKTTLSVVDLAELSMTVPEDFKAWAADTTELIKNDQFKLVSDARQGTREFAVSSKIDQIDLVHFTEKLGTEEGKKLASTIKEAVKYNRFSRTMTHCNGVSIYFPYQKKGSVDKAIQINDQIGMDAEYSSCIREFAGLQTSAQVASGGQTSPLSSLLGTAGSAFSGGSSSSLSTALQIMQAMSSMSGGNFKGIRGLTSENTQYLSRRELSDEQTAQYIEKNQFDPGKLVWTTNKDGDTCISLPEEQWELVHSVDLNCFIDDGEGYIDLGLDNIYSTDEEGNLLPDTEGTWLTVNGQAVAYYHTDTVEDGDKYAINGYVPARLNGEKVKLILSFTDEKPGGEVLGARPDYDLQETETVARGLMEISDGDRIEFLCDYYGYDGTYQDSYLLGDELTVKGPLEISDKKLENQNIYALYRFTDIYDQAYFSDPVR